MVKLPNDTVSLSDDISRSQNLSQPGINCEKMDPESGYTCYFKPIKGENDEWQNAAVEGKKCFIRKDGNDSECRFQTPKGTCVGGKVALSFGGTYSWPEYVECSNIPGNIPGPSTCINGAPCTGEGPTKIDGCKSSYCLGGVTMPCPVGLVWDSTEQSCNYPPG